MENLSLEVFDLEGTGSKYAVLDPDATITITDTSEIFASGDVWSHSFTLNVHANSHIFGTSGDLHGSRLHEQINKRRARLWVEGLPLFLGYLKLDDEVEVDAEGNVDVGFESGQKTFEEMIEGTSATEVSVGDVVIGVALNRKRTVETTSPGYSFTLDGLAAYAEKDESLKPVVNYPLDFRGIALPGEKCYTAYTQRWPKMVKSHGTIYNSAMQVDSKDDYTNVQTPYDAGHPFCNINICYPFKAKNKAGEEMVARGYTVRLAHGKPTTHGGDNETRYNNAPNFYLLYWVDRLFKDLGIHITENQAKDVEDLRRVFMLNYGCHYEEIENDSEYFDSDSHATPADKPDGTPMLSRYGQYYIRVVDQPENDGDKRYLLRKDWWTACMAMDPDNGHVSSSTSKLLLRDIELTVNGENKPVGSSAECKATGSYFWSTISGTSLFSPRLKLNDMERSGDGVYSAYLAYATGDNYPHVEISEIIEAMKSMFGVRLLFNNDYSTVRIVMLRNIFRNQEVQDIDCEIEDKDEKVENCIRGFRMTYGKGKDDTSFYYKGFADLFNRKSKTWKDTSDKHDYSQWDLDADYDEIKQHVSAMNKICYVTPVNGNAYGVKVDEDENVLFPSLLEYADFMDAEDGDCSQFEEDGKTVEEISINATPVIMNETGTVYASLFSGDMKAPAPVNIPEDVNGKQSEQPFIDATTTIGTFARITNTGSVAYDSGTLSKDGTTFRIKANIDAYSCEGFAIRMEDNYAISNGGTPFDEADPGLCFGIMRSSGDDAFVRYYDDPDDDEDNNQNDAWEVVPGSGAVSHPDTCNNYGNLWNYDGKVVINTASQAVSYLHVFFPNSHAEFNNSAGYINGPRLMDVTDNVGKIHHVLFDKQRTNGSTATQVITMPELKEYISALSGHSTAYIMAMDAADKKLIIELDSSDERSWTLIMLTYIAYGGGSGPYEIDENGVGVQYGRFSLKLRAEKLNPYYIPSLPDIVSTKQEAGIAMTKLYTTSNTDLLNRPVVSNATMRAAGWDCPGDGYATVYSMGYGVQCSDGMVHEILWTPIRTSTFVMTRQELMNYIALFNGLSIDRVKAVDKERLRLILDIDTTEQRAEVLHELQAIYYAEDEGSVGSVDITPVNPRYLSIDNENLRGRGLCDQFYKEYSYWVRNARIVKRTVHMELAQLLSIDKTKKVRVGDITGFIRKMQYTVSNQTGLGDVTMEIMYI